MADDDLVQALMEDPANRQTLMQRYAPNLDWMPDIAKKYLLEALKVPLGFAFRGPIMSGPAKGLTPQDFVTASRLSDPRKYGYGQDIVGGAPNTPPKWVDSSGHQRHYSSPQLAASEGMVSELPSGRATNAVNANNRLLDLIRGGKAD